MALSPFITSLLISQPAESEEEKAKRKKYETEREKEETKRRKEEAKKVAAEWAALKPIDRREAFELFKSAISSARTGNKDRISMYRTLRREWNSILEKDTNIK